MKKITTLLFALTSLLLVANAQTIGDYRSAATGDWSEATTWQRFNGAWVAASSAPASSDGVISILTMHTVTVSNSVTADQIVVNAGGTLAQEADLNLDNGAGDDLTVNGTWSWQSSQSSSIGGPGNAVIASGGTLILVNIGDKIIAAAITNNGTINWQEGPLYFDAEVTVTNNGTMNINGNNVFQDREAAGTFINNGTVTKSSTGTTTFSMSTMTNSSTGTIMGVGEYNIFSTTFNSNGIIAPGLSPGLLTVNTTFSQLLLSANSTLTIEMLNGSGPGTGHDQLRKNVHITLAGTLTVTETGTVPNGTYTIINISTGIVSGSFATTNLPAGYTLQVNATNVQVIKNIGLPLTLISFIAQKTADNKVNLQWITMDEQNVSHFEVQRSADGVNYTRMAIVQALNSPVGGTYSYRDETPLTKTNYYRVRMVDLDASAKLSPVRVVKFTGNNQVLVFPTVTTDKVYIQTDKVVMVKLFSLAGTLLQQKQMVGKDFIGLSHLSAGMYVLRIGEEGRSEKIIKQ